MAQLYPVRKHLTCTAGGLDADRVESAGHKKVFELGRFTQKVSIIRCEAFGTVEKQADACSLKCRISIQCRFEDRLEVFEIIWKRIKFKVFRDAIHAPRFGDGFKAPKRSFPVSTL